MAGQRSSFGKLQRDRAKKAKASAKRERRVDKTDTTGGDEAAPASTGQDSELSAGQLLAEIELVHRRFESKEIDYEEFEEKKAELLARLPID